MGFAYQALITLAGLACTVLFAVGLAKDQPVTTPADSPIAAIEQLESSCESAEAGTFIAEAEPEADPGRVEPPVAQPSAAQATPSVLRRVYRITAYNDRGATASGRQSGVGQCAAPADIPFGSRIYIPALRRTLVVTDRTHPRFRHNTVDIFMPHEQQCLNFGRKYLKCEITLPSAASTPHAKG